MNDKNKLTKGDDSAYFTSLMQHVLAQCNNDEKEAERVLQLIIVMLRGKGCKG